MASLTKKASSEPESSVAFNLHAVALAPTREGKVLRSLIASYPEVFKDPEMAEVYATIVKQFEEELRHLRPLDQFGMVTKIASVVAQAASSGIRAVNLEERKTKRGTNGKRHKRTFWSIYCEIAQDALARAGEEAAADRYRDC